MDRNSNRVILVVMDGVGHREESQFNAVKQAGYNLKDSKVRDKLNELHKYIRKNKLNLGWEELLELINEWLG